MYMSLSRFLPLFALTLFPSVQAVDIHGQARQSCATGQATVAICNGIASNTCCVFPAGGIIAQGAYFSVIYDCCVGIWYYRSNSNAGCASTRDYRYGYQQYACITGSAQPGGGAAWFDIRQTICGGRKRGELEAPGPAPEVGNCTSTVQATVLAFEGDGAWVLEPGTDEFEKYNALPPTDDVDEHLLNMKEFGTWYANFDDHPAAAAAMKRSNSIDEGPSFEIE